jgi:hypothetical protein
MRLKESSFNGGNCAVAQLGIERAALSVAMEHAFVCEL